MLNMSHNTVSTAEVAINTDESDLFLHEYDNDILLLEDSEYERDEKSSNDDNDALLSDGDAYIAAAADYNINNKHKDTTYFENVCTLDLNGSTLVKSIGVAATDKFALHFATRRNVQFVYEELQYEKGSNPTYRCGRQLFHNTVLKASPQLIYKQTPEWKKCIPDRYDTHANYLRNHIVHDMADKFVMLNLQAPSSEAKYEDDCNDTYDTLYMSDCFRILAQNRDRYEPFVTLPNCIYRSHTMYKISVHRRLSLIKECRF